MGAKRFFRAKMGPFSIRDSTSEWADGGRVSVPPSLGHEGSSKRARNLLRVVAWDASECGGLRRCVSEIIKKSGNVWDESLTLHHEIFPRYIAFLTLSRSIVVG